jgi:hypothetical protein
VYNFSTETIDRGMDLALLPPEVFRVPTPAPLAEDRRSRRGAAVASQVENLNREYRMTRWPRRMTALFLAAVLAAGVSCTSDDSLGPSAPAGPSTSVTETQGQQSDLLLGGLLNTLQNLNLLSCSPQPYASRTQVVGANGGTILVGTHKLVIPAGALSQNYTIRAEQVTHRVNSVRFSPEGLRFAKPAKLTLSYSNCSPLLLLKRVVYTDELLRILELIPSLDNLRTKTVTGDIRHFSRYAVAW